MKLLVAVCLTVALISAIALGQVTLGNVFKLGTSTTASLPVCTATIRGGLIYDTDTDPVWKVVP